MKNELMNYEKIMNKQEKFEKKDIHGKRFD